MTEISREEFEAFRRDVISRLERLEAKIDDLAKCTYQKMPRSECEDHRNGIWGKITRLEKWIYMGLGIAIAIEAIVLPLIWTLARR